MAGVDFDKENICVVIPAFNEGEKVGGVLSKVRDLKYPVLLVDDGSTDETPRIAKALTGVHVISLSPNQGKGAALRKGMDWCLARNYAAVLLMDADGQHRPEELGLFLDELRRGEGDVIVGNRMLHPEGMPLLRRATNQFLSWVTSRLTHQRIPDSQCGFRVLKAEVLRKLSLRTTHFEIESEMLFQASKHGFKIVSIPIRSVYEGAKSQIHPLKDTLRFFRFLFTYFFQKI